MWNIQCRLSDSGFSSLLDHCFHFWLWNIIPGLKRSDQRSTSYKVLLQSLLFSNLYMIFHVVLLAILFPTLKCHGNVFSLAGQKVEISMVCYSGVCLRTLLSSHYLTFTVRMSSLFKNSVENADELSKHTLAWTQKGWWDLSKIWPKDYRWWEQSRNLELWPVWPVCSPEIWDFSVCIIKYVISAFPQRMPNMHTPGVRPSSSHRKAFCLCDTEVYVLVMLGADRTHGKSMMLFTSSK